MATIQDLEALVLELHTIGLIEFTDDVNFKLTEKGLENAKNILKRLPFKDRFIVLLASDILAKCIYDK